MSHRIRRCVRRGHTTCAERFCFLLLRCLVSRSITAAVTYALSVTPSSIAACFACFAIRSGIDSEVRGLRKARFFIVLLRLVYSCEYTASVSLPLY